MDASGARRARRYGFQLKGHYGFWTLCGTILILGGWMWTRFQSSPDSVLAFQPGVSVLMVLLATLYVLTMLAWSFLLGASLGTSQLATWPLLVAFLILSLLTTAFLGMALWGLAPLST